MASRELFKGFSLSELLIALAILGVIVIFTIPKVLQVQSDSKYKAIGKETIASIAAAYIAYVNQNGYTTTFKASDLTPYLNFVKYDTATPIDDIPTMNNYTCTGTAPCLLLHNGSRLMTHTVYTMAGTNSTNAVTFLLDPDGQYSNTTNGPGKGLKIFLYYNGRVNTWASIYPGTYAEGASWSANPSLDPPWFNWD